MLPSAPLLIALVGTAPLKLAVTPLSAGDGTTQGMVNMLGEAVTAELRRQRTFQVLSQNELKTVLSHEQLKQLVGCDDPSCYANIGTAAGAAGLATGSIGKIGRSWLINLKIIDVGRVRVVAAADRRIKGGEIDDVLDHLPGMVQELVEGASGKLSAASPRSAPATVAVSATSTGHPLPAAVADTDYADAAIRGRLEIVTDGRGHYLAFDEALEHKSPLFAGAASALYQQRVSNRGRQGEGKWSQTFWDPRYSRGAEKYFQLRDGKYTLVCGERKIAYTPAKDADKVRKQARLLAASWRRRAVYFARDDMGTYYYVDQALEPRSNSDYRLFIGTRGKVTYHPVNDAIVEPGSAIFIAELGRLIVKRERDGDNASWGVGQSLKPLTLLSLFSQAETIYTKLGAYAGQSLGTACDPHAD